MSKKSKSSSKSQSKSRSNPKSEQKLPESPLLNVAPENIEQSEANETVSVPAPITPPVEPNSVVQSSASEPAAPAESAITLTQPTTQPAASPNARRRRRQTAALIIAGLFVLLAAGFFWRAHHADTAEQVTAANRSLIAEVSQRAVLPKGETPTITTVVDKDKANQSFLANAANGDKVLLYFQAGRAVLYRPSTHQVVNIGPLAQPPAKVFLRDGSSADIPTSIRTNLSGPAGFTIVSQDKSAKQDYATTLVVDLAGNRPDIAARAAKLVGGKVVTLPAGESRPEADILIIVGTDAK